MELLISFLLLLLVFIFIPVLIIYAYLRDKKKEIKHIKSNVGLCIFNDRKVGAPLNLSSVTGILIVYNVRNINDKVCLIHGRQLYYEYQKNTLIKGWWSLYGLIRTPLYLIKNFSDYLRFRKAFKLLYREKLVRVNE
jgi:hypothetical protein